MISKKKVIIFSNAERDIGFGMAREVACLLRQKGRETALCPMLSGDDALDAVAAGSGLEASVLESELPAAEIIIAIGGDGTILQAARAAAGFEVPVLGINMGGKGFMAELEADEVGLIGAVADGRYKTERRMMLDAAVVRGGETVCRDFALNDIVIKGDNKVIDLTLFGDEQRITHFSGDGAVVSTPTGSTAYSMAAGGPIVEPSAHNIIVTPICAHVLEAKSFVLVSDRRVTVEIGYKKHNPAYMSADGGEHYDIEGGDIVTVQKSKMSAMLAHITDGSFYKKVSEKLAVRFIYN